jgi:hypothetical protein
MQKYTSLPKAAKKAIASRQQRRHPQQQAASTDPPAASDAPEGTVPSVIDPVSKQRFGENGIQYVRPKRDEPAVPGQNWWVMSYVTPTGEKGMRSRDVVVKNSGAYATVEEAERRAEYIRNQEPRISVYVVSMYELLTIPIPIDVDQGVRKHYMDARLDAIMVNQYKQVTQARKEMDNRINSEKQKALASMRRSMNDPNYQLPTPPEDAKKNAESLTEARVTKPVKYQVETIVETFLETMKNFEGKPVDESFLSAVMENLGQAKADADAVANAAREQKEREGLQNITATHAPAVADGLITSETLRSSDVGGDGDGDASSAASSADRPPVEYI